MKGTAKTLGAIVATAILGIAGTVVSPQIARAQKVIVKELLAGSIVLKVPVQLKLMMPGVGYKVYCRLYAKKVYKNPGGYTVHKTLESPEAGAVSSAGSFNKTLLFVFKPSDVQPSKALSKAKWYFCRLVLKKSGSLPVAPTAIQESGSSWSQSKPGTLLRYEIQGYLPGKGPGGAVMGFDKKSLGAAAPKK